MKIKVIYYQHLNSVVFEENKWYMLSLDQQLECLSIAESEKGIETLNIENTYWDDLTWINESDRKEIEELLSQEKQETNYEIELVWVNSFE